MLNDAELESCLRITNPMHRKKLRLAIEEQRNPSLIRYPCMAQLGHTWVCNEWLPDIGLAQVKNTRLYFSRMFFVYYVFILRSYCPLYTMFIDFSMLKVFQKTWSMLEC